ncbi:hypothetical protein JN09_000572 [Acholeplasma morum]|uniref:hypothetical protein n=1 Tax=Paracholeplasma morum TaxID=264637 RepID=UPI0019587A9F|nr:hypothetical protein [Paracholeplasma morum]MBM7453247.1 hypothetical protein [Paracholeplasma morum]
MKKYMIVLLVLITVSFRGVTLNADADYESFESIEMPEGIFLKDYTKENYKEYYKKVTKRRFAGWNVFIVTEDAKVIYRTETIFSYHNDGSTAIDYEYKYDGTKSTSRSITASGTIGINASGTVKKFKGGLESSIKKTSNVETSSKENETWKIKMQVDPGTMANLYIHGEGKITNGVAAKYAFWILLEKGGFEVFVVTTQYYRLEKVKI